MRNVCNVCTMQAVWAAKCSSQNCQHFYMCTIILYNSTGNRGQLFEPECGLWLASVTDHFQTRVYNSNSISFTLIQCQRGRIVKPFGCIKAFHSTALSLISHYSFPTHMDQSTFSLNEGIVIPIMYTAKATLKLYHIFFRL